MEIPGDIAQNEISTGWNYYPLNLHKFQLSYLLAAGVTCLTLVLAIAKKYSGKSRVPKCVPFLSGTTLFGSGSLCAAFRHPEGVYKGFLHYILPCDNGLGLVKSNVLGQEIVILTSPAMVNKLLLSGELGHLNKPSLYHPIFGEYLFGKGLITSEVKVWSPHRAALAKSFTLESLKSYLPIMNMFVKELISNLRNDGVSVTPTDDSKSDTISHLIAIYTYSVIIYATAGVDVSSNPESEVFLEFLERWKNAAHTRFRYPWLLLKPLWMLHPDYKKTVEGHNNTVKFLGKQYDRFHNKQQHDDVLDDLNKTKGFTPMLEVMHNAGFSKDEVISEWMTIVTGGQETNAMSLTLLLLNLAQSPRHQNLCREEVDHVFNNKSDSNLTYDDLCSLKQLERCIKESLRLVPLVSLYGRMLESNLRLDENLELGKGLLVVVFPTLLHMNPEYFPNPDVFDSDRFLPENCIKRHPLAYIPFSSGRRNCIGWKYATLQVTLVAAWILRHFKVYSNHKLEDIKWQFSATISPDKPISLILKEREPHK